MNVVLSDLKHSIRTLLRVPGFTVTAVGTLALGIGATTAIFSIVNAVLLRRLAVTDPDRFVMLLTTEISATGEIIRADSDSSPLKFELWRQQASVLQDVSAFFPGVMNYSGGGWWNSGDRLKCQPIFSDAGGYRLSEGAPLHSKRIFRAGRESRRSARNFGHGNSPAIQRFSARRSR
jgi:hypothetical protein